MEQKTPQAHFMAEAKSGLMAGKRGLVMPRRVPSWLSVPVTLVAMCGHASCSLLRGRLRISTTPQPGSPWRNRRLRNGIAKSAIHPCEVMRPSESHTWS